MVSSFRLSDAARSSGRTKLDGRSELMNPPTGTHTSLLFIAPSLLVSCSVTQRASGDSPTTGEVVGTPISFPC